MDKLTKFQEEELIILIKIFLRTNTRKELDKLIDKCENRVETMDSIYKKIE